MIEDGIMNAGSVPSCCPSYTVKPGDTAASVAAAQSVDPTVLTFYNQLPANASLKPGQTLFIPCARILQYAQQLKASGGATKASRPTG